MRVEDVGRDESRIAGDRAKRSAFALPYLPFSRENHCAILDAASIILMKCQ